MSVTSGLRDKALKIIFSALDLINAEKDSAVKLTMSEEAALMGAEANLDSFELVSLVLSVESKLGEDLGAGIILADEKAMSQRSSPFRTVGAMADYIVKVIEERERG
jgi:D-alanine--poly(phosphoribitol) ligase subunit 2